MIDATIRPHIAPLIAAARVSDGDLFHAVKGLHPYNTHQEYEHLHPFTDGNGRSGRALWLWMMLRTPYAERAKQLGFLHSWYYQSLENGR